MSEKLLPCPLAIKTKHNPYLASWDEKMGELSCFTAQVKCDCGCSGPMRFGENAEKEAIDVWNTRAPLAGGVRAEEVEEIEGELSREQEHLRYVEEFAGNIVKQEFHKGALFGIKLLSQTIAAKLGGGNEGI